MADNENGIKETILYYPTISVPSNKWLRQALLYWDEIGSIVPRAYEAKKPFTDDIKYLIDEGQFRPFRTQFLERHWEVIQEFQNELRDKIRSPNFQRKLAPRQERIFNTRIHKEKISGTMFDFFVEAELAVERQNFGDWYYFEHKTAMLFMSVLAKYLAEIDSEHTITGTDSRQYNDLNFHSRQNREPLQTLNVKFFNILPVPNENNSIQSIVEFKKQRKDELGKFRKTLKQFQKKVSECESNSELKETLSDFQLEIQNELNDLEKTMGESKLSIIAGSIETLLKPTSPAWLPLAATGLG